MSTAAARAARWVTRLDQPVCRGRPPRIEWILLILFSVALVDRETILTRWK